MKNEEWAQKYDKLKEDTYHYMAARQIVNITNTIAARMEERGISQRKLAKELGVSQPYISKFLNHGANMSIQTLSMFAHALDMVVETQLIPKEHHEQWDQYCPTSAKVGIARIKVITMQRSKKPNDADMVQDDITKKIREGENDKYEITLAA